MSQGEHRDRRPTGRVGGRILEGRLSSAGDAPSAAVAGGVPPRYRLRCSIEVLPVPDGRLYLLRPGRPDLLIRQPDAADRAVLDALVEGPATVPGLQRRLAGQGIELDGTAIAGKLAALVHADAVGVERGVPAELSPDDEERFARQLPYLAEAGDPAVAQLRLRDATVVVLGCGGLGTWALLALASAGVGRFVIIDHDVVELSNLNRQIAYGVADLGRGKATVAAERVRELDPEITVVPVVRRVDRPADLAPHLADADVLVLVADEPPYELGRWVNAACLVAGVPFILAGQLPPLLRVGPMHVPGVSACFECHERALRRGSAVYDQLVEQRRRHNRPAATLGPASAVVGALLSTEVLHLLMRGGGVATEGRAMLLDMGTLESHWEPIARDPDCPACHHLG